jgi:F0F1-type ATP synthase membrane subunit b/b'
MKLSLELLKSIQEAEAQAEAERANAQREAREILKGVTEACTENERHAAVEHRALFQSMQDEKKKQVEQKLTQLAAVKEQKRDELMRTVQQRLPMAADRIAERILSDGNR